MRIVAAPGAAVVQLSDWVASKNDAAKTALLDEHVASGRALTTSAFNALVSQFLTETNQTLTAE